MPLTEREVGLLWRYHDWLVSQRYILCERVWPPEPRSRGTGTYTYQPVHAPEVASLVARFMAHEAGGADQATGDRRQATEGQEADRTGERNDG